IESARDLFGPERLTQIISVQVAPGADAATVLTRLELDPAILGRFGVFYEDAYTRRNTEILRDLLGLVHLASGLAFLAVGLGAYMATALHLAERSRESALLRLSGFSRGQVGVYLLLRTEMLAAVAFCIGVPLASVWMGALYSRGPAYVFNVPVRPAVDPGLIAVFAMMTALSAFAGAAISAAGLLRASVAQGLRS
ncbi:MAG: FtsX-like permease family protein, partial [Thermoflexales bacterium]